MKHIVKAAAIASLLIGFAGTAKADYTWTFEATYYSYAQYPEAVFDESGLDPVQDIVGWSGLESLPASPSISGTITFDNLGTPTSWNFSSNPTNPALPELMSLDYNGFTATNNYYSASPDDFLSGSGWWGAGDGKFYFLDTDTQSVVFQFDLPAALYTGIYSNGDQVAIAGGGQEWNAACQTDPYFFFEGCYQNGSTRSDYDDQTQSTNLKFTYVAENNNTDTPEPATLALLGTGLVALGVGRRRFSKKD